MYCDLNVLDSIIFVTQMCLHQGAQLDDPRMTPSRHLNSAIDLVTPELTANYRESRAASNAVHVVVTRCMTNPEKKTSQESDHKSRPT